MNNLEDCLFSSVQLLSHVWLFATPWTAAHQASLSITNSLSLLKLMFIESMMSSNHLILCHPVLLPPSIFPSIRVFSNESVLHIRWPKYWSFSFSIIPSKELPGWSPSEWTGWISLQSKGLSRVFSNHTVQKLWHLVCVNKSMSMYYSGAINLTELSGRIIMQCLPFQLLVLL